MQRLDRLMQVAIASALVCAAIEAPAAPMEKCYGIAKAHLNDCQTASASCAGSAAQDAAPDAYLLVPQGLCLKIVGGSLHASKEGSVSLTNTAPLSPQAFSAGNYLIEPTHSTVLWHISHAGFSAYHGKWFVKEGSIDLDDKHPENSHVMVKIALKDVVTGHDELNQHILSPAFFDVSNYPEATFVSTRVKQTGKYTANVYGNLTMHNVTKPIVLKMTLNKVATHPITNKLTVGFTGSTTINRRDFGITSLPKEVLGDEVPIEINIEAYKKET